MGQSAVVKALPRCRFWKDRNVTSLPIEFLDAKVSTENISASVRQHVEQTALEPTITNIIFHCFCVLQEGTDATVETAEHETNRLQPA